MIEIESDNADERPLPRTWLPDPVAPASDATWRRQREDIVAGAKPALYELQARVNGDSSAWLNAIGSLWVRAAAGLAVAAATMLVVRPVPTPATAENVNVLEIVATDGKPDALWRAYGIEADPVLALIATEPTR